jgi:hypothetical protein
MKTLKNINQFKPLLLLILGISITFFACRKTDKPTTNSNIWTNTAQVVASVSGQVLDENGTPLVGAEVKVGNHSFTTTSNGIFFFKNISTAEKATLIEVIKPGYFKGYRTLSITKNKDHFTRIRVMKADNPQNFTASNDAAIIAAGGASINIAKNSIMNAATGVAFNGIVQITAKTIKALDPNIAELTPGALRGINTAGEENALATYGMLAVEMQDANGNALQIATGKTAEIRMPIAAAQLATAPATIPLWHFDEAKAMWVEDGSATKVGTEYIGKVTHFSYWNCDYGGPICQFDATFLDAATNNPMSGIQVQLVSSLASAGTRSSWTNASGSATGGIPTNTSYTLNLIDQCGTSFYTTTFTTTTAAISLGTILVTLPVINGAVISGNVVDCSSIAIPNALVSISAGTNSTIVYADASGNFSYSTTICASPASYSFAAYDPTTFVSGSLVASIVAGANAIGTVAACGTINEFITYSITEASGTKSFSHLAPADVFTTSYNSTVTQISTYSQNTVGYKSLYFSFDGAGTTGAHTINSFNHYSFSGGTSYSCSSDSMGTPIAVPINITQYGSALGSFIGGNFSGSFTTTTPVNSYTITGSFTTKRDF